MSSTTQGDSTSLASANDLTHDQVEEILTYCDKNLDYDFGMVAHLFSIQFGKPVSKDVVYGLYIEKELARHSR